jgi:chromosome segregation ATPase
MAEVRYRITAKDQTKKATQSAQKNVGGLKKSAAGLGKSFASALVPIASVTAGLAALTKTISDSVKAYSKQEEAVTRLTSALQASGAEVESVSAELQAHASALQEVTTFGDEAIIQQQSFLASLGYTKNEIKELTTAAVNLASSGMVTLDSAVKNLVRTKSGLSGELGEIIPQIRNLTKEELEAGEAIDVVQKQFDGMAESLADTGVGALKQYRNAMGDLKEQFGKTLVDAIRPFVEGLTNVIQKMTDAISKSRTLKKALDNLEDPTKNVSEAGRKAIIEQKITEITNKIAGYQATIKSGYATNTEQLENQIEKLEKQRELYREWLESNNKQGSSLGNIQGKIEGINDDTEEQVTLTDKVLKIYAETLGKLQPLNEKHEDWNEVIDVGAKKADILQDALQKMFDLGVQKPTGWPTIVHLIELLKEAGEKTEEAKTKLTKLFELSGEAAMVFEQGRPRRDRGDTGRRPKGFESEPPPSPASSPTDVTGAMSPFIGALKDAAGKLEGFAGTLAQSMAQIGPIMGLLVAGFKRILSSLTTLLNPLINGILVPLTTFLDQIAKMLASMIAPILKALYPVIAIVVTWLKILAQVISFPAQVIIKTLLPVLKVFGTVMQWLYNKIIAPIGIAIFTVFEHLGNALTTLYNMLIAPVLYSFAEVIAWLHNKIIRPVGNAILDAMNTVAKGLVNAINAIIKLVNKIPGINISKLGKPNIGGAGIEKINLGDKSQFEMGQWDFSGMFPGQIDTGNLPGMGTLPGDAGSDGTRATYQRARPIKINVYVEGNNFNGAGGLREFVQLIRDELESLEVLQV